ncbi:MAG: sulfotransferase, partial [Candidatus Omnitrophica bacterium]|nr:sulfotransferase [Candidatus Omnitrophota bacterium]
YIQSISREVCKVLGIRFCKADGPASFNNDIRSFLERKHPDFFCYNNANYDYVRQIDNYKGFHVVRDPRDMIVSAYFSHKYSHPVENSPKLAMQKKELNEVSEQEGLFLVMEYMADVFRDMMSWDRTDPNVKEVRMEEFVNDAYTVFVAVFHFLGLADETVSRTVDEWKYLISNSLRKITGRGFVLSTIPLGALLAIIWRNRFSRKAADRKPGEEDTHSHYRKGIAGDWKNYFNDKHKIYFMKRYNDLLLKYGYEKDTEWH